jgi:hypothetical protein
LKLEKQNLRAKSKSDKNVKAKNDFSLKEKRTKNGIIISQIQLQKMQTNWWEKKKKGIL